MFFLRPSLKPLKQILTPFLLLLPRVSIQRTWCSLHGSSYTQHSGRLHHRKTNSSHCAILFSRGMHNLYILSLLNIHFIASCPYCSSLNARLTLAGRRFLTFLVTLKAHFAENQTSAYVGPEVRFCFPTSISSVNACSTDLLCLKRNCHSYS